MTGTTQPPANLCVGMQVTSPARGQVQIPLSRGGGELKQSVGPLKLPQENKNCLSDERMVGLLTLIGAASVVETLS